MSNPFELSDEIKNKLLLLQSKLNKDNQELGIYLDKLLYSKYLTYWDYINLETLLSLQKPITNFDDEMLFIIFHQITELYFKLILFEIEKVQTNLETISLETFAESLYRLNHYLNHVSKSFSIVSDVMKHSEFEKFRIALFPASGFQSIQYRKIEIASTDLYNLIDDESKETITNPISLEESFLNIYWKKGATEKQTGTGSLTLRMFEEKYTQELISFAIKQEKLNLWKCYKKIIEKFGFNEEITLLMKRYDTNFNINLGLAHLKAAVKHLKNTNSTGGTNWQKYLPPKYKKIIFFPELWSKEEKMNWGKNFLFENE